MTSTEWQKLIDDVAADITTKERRLGEIVHEKVAAILEPKKLLRLEAEEAAIPGLIEQLRRRLPLLAHEHEGALKTEAEERLRELEQQGAVSAVSVSESTAGIRETMLALLDRIGQANGTWEMHEVIKAEAAYLCARFALSPLQLPPGDRISGEERGRFTRQCEHLFRQVPNTQLWSRLRADFQESQRRTEQERRAAEDARLPNIPIRIDYRDSSRHTEERRNDGDANHEPITTYTYWNDGISS